MINPPSDIPDDLLAAALNTTVVGVGVAAEEDAGVATGVIVLAGALAEVLG